VVEAVHEQARALVERGVDRSADDIGPARARPVLHGRQQRRARRLAAGLEEAEPCRTLVMEVVVRAILDRRRASGDAAVRRCVTLTLMVPGGAASVEIGRDSHGHGAPIAAAIRAIPSAWFTPDPRVYWADLLASASIGWAAFALGVAAGPGLRAVLLIVAAF